MTANTLHAFGDHGETQTYWLLKLFIHVEAGSIVTDLNGEKTRCHSFYGDVNTGCPGMFDGVAHGFTEAQKALLFIHFIQLKVVIAA